MILIPFLLYIQLNNGTEIDWEMCSKQQCQEIGKAFKKNNKDVKSIICFTNVPKKNTPFLIKKDCKND